ncbi:MAG: hypothetical protein LBC52_08055 [Treponema sp.]|jgi:hypothetical protein|nr:hypothetical protein [Treponema sp.]
MTHTIQPCSWATLSNAEKELNQTEDNRVLLLSVFDSMNKLIETVNKLNYVLQRKRLEHILYQEDKKEGEEK